MSSFGWLNNKVFYLFCKWEKLRLAELFHPIAHPIAISTQSRKQQRLGFKPKSFSRPCPNHNQLFHCHPLFTSTLTEQPTTYYCLGQGSRVPLLLPRSKQRWKWYCLNNRTETWLEHQGGVQGQGLVNCELIRAFPLTCHLPGEAGSGPHLILLSGVEIRRVVTEQAKLRGGGLSTLGLQLPDFLVILEGDGYIAQSPPPRPHFPEYVTPTSKP